MHPVRVVTLSILMVLGIAGCGGSSAKKSTEPEKLTPGPDAAGDVAVDPHPDSPQTARTPEPPRQSATASVVDDTRTEAIVDGPWKPILAQTELPTFNDVCFRLAPISPVHDGDEQRWFKPIDSRPFKLSRSENGIDLEGIASIESPWPSDGCLRLHVTKLDTLTFSFVSQTHELAVTLDSKSLTCRAFRTPLKDGATRSDRWFYGNDSGRWRHSSGSMKGPIDIQFRDNHLWLTRGDLVWLRVPFRGVPKSAQAQGRVSFTDVELIRFRNPLTLAQGTSEADIRSLSSPTIRKSQQASQSTWTLPSHAFCTFRFQVKDGPLNCFIDSGDKTKLLFTSEELEAGIREVTVGSPKKNLLLPVAATYGRISFGLTHAELSLSQSEHHWAPVASVELPPSTKRRVIFRSESDEPASITKVRFSCPPIFNAKTRSLNPQKEEFAIGRLWQIWQSADTESRKGVIEKTASLLWHAQTEEQTVESIRLLVLAYSQENGLEAIPQLLSLGRYTNEAASRTLIKTVARFAYSYSVDHDHRPFTETRKHLTRVSLPLKLQLADGLASLAWAELLQSIYGERPKRAVELLNRLRFIGIDSQLKWFQAAVARVRIDVSDGKSELFQSQTRWTELWREELNRNAYNIISEIAALRQTDSLKGVLDALLADHVPLEGLGASPADKQVFLSVPTAAYWLHEATPELTELSRKTKQEAASRLIRSAEQSRNYNRADYLATVLRGTRAASSYNQDAGDRAISHGSAGLASWYYARALKSAVPSHEKELQSRVEMFRAMRGESSADKVAELPARVSDRAGGAFASRDDVSEALFQIDKPRVEFSLKNTKVSPAPSNMQNGLESGGQFVRVLSQAKIDWWQNQFNVVQSGELVLLHNRYELRALRRTDGGVAWKATISGKPRMSAVDWINTSSRPLKLHDAILSRFYYGSSPLLAAHREADGKLLAQHVFVNEHMVSDPFLANDRLLGIIARPSRQNQIVTILLAEFDPVTCEPISYRQLLELEGGWWSRKFCQVTSIPDGFIAALGGVILLADEFGTLRWVRKRDNWLSGDHLSELQQRHVPPIVQEGRVLVAEVGNWHVTCLNSRTGSRVWRRLFPELQDLHYSEQGAIVIERNNLHLLDLTSGKITWSKQLAMRITTSLPVRQALIIGGMRKQQNEFESPQLISLAIATGAQLEHLDVPANRSMNGTLGPIVGYFESRNGVYYGANQSKPDRTFLRFEE